MPPRVLVVDDQEDVLNTLVRFLSMGGYDVVGLSEFEDAKGFIDRTPPDILVTDVRLGAFNGLQLALHMRAARADTPIVVLSAWDDALLRQEATGLGAVYCLKPLKRDQLLDAVATAARAASRSDL
jgi:DNA-binding response OmpR family regulator